MLSSSGRHVGARLSKMQVHGVGARHAKLCSSRYPRHCSEESGGGGVRRLWLRTLSDALGGQRRKPTDAFGGDGGRVRRQRRAVWADASAALGGDRGRAPRPEFALHGYFDALRVELYARSIAVQLVCPGPVRSDLTKHVHGSDAGDSQAGGDRGGGGGGGGVGGGVVGGRRGSSGKLVVVVVVVVVLGTVLLLLLVLMVGGDLASWWRWWWRWWWWSMGNLVVRGWRWCGWRWRWWGRAKDDEILPPSRPSGRPRSGRPRGSFVRGADIGALPPFASRSFSSSGSRPRGAARPSSRGRATATAGRRRLRTNDPTIQPEASKMPTERCAFLMAVATHFRLAQAPSISRWSRGHVSGSRARTVALAVAARARVRIARHLAPLRRRDGLCVRRARARISTRRRDSLRPPGPCPRRARRAQTWISKQPELFFTALFQYAPATATPLANVLGQARPELKRETRSDGATRKPRWMRRRKDRACPCEGQSSSLPTVPRVRRGWMRRGRA